MIEPLRLAFDVDCSAEHAFRIWTERTSRWWPVSHSVSVEPGLEVVIEGRVGGRIFERTPTGAEHDWGEVTSWEPPRRFSYLWHLRADRADATDVDISFIGRPDGRTRVEILHTGWERLGSRGQERRDANAGGWAGVLPLFVEAAAGTQGG